MANLAGDFSALFFQDFRPPPQKKIHAQTSRPEVSACLSDFTFSNPFFFHADFLLTGRSRKTPFAPLDPEFFSVRGSPLYF